MKTGTWYIRKAQDKNRWKKTHQASLKTNNNNKQCKINGF